MGSGKGTMSRRAKAESKDEMRAEYDFSQGIRGKYLERYKKGSIVVTLEPDVAEVFRDSASVNQALRLLANLSKAQVRR
jgi:hypothetical protein